MQWGGDWGRKMRVSRELRRADLRGSFPIALPPN